MQRTMSDDELRKIIEDLRDTGRMAPMKAAALGIVSFIGAFTMAQFAPMLSTAWIGTYIGWRIGKAHAKKMRNAVTNHTTNGDR